MTKKIDKVTRFEVIDHRSNGQGRILVTYGIKVELLFQDEDRTLKIRLTDAI